LPIKYTSMENSEKQQPKNKTINTDKLIEQILDIVECNSIGITDQYTISLKLKNLFSASGQLPLDFVKWYSGMEEKKILKAYERWKTESGSLPNWWDLQIEQLKELEKVIEKRVKELEGNDL
jgi:hypothetical protein